MGKDTEVTKKGKFFSLDDDKPKSKPKIKKKYNTLD